MTMHIQPCSRCSGTIFTEQGALFDVNTTFSEPMDAMICHRCREPARWSKPIRAEQNFGDRVRQFHVRLAWAFGASGITALVLSFLLGPGWYSWVLIPYFFWSLCCFPVVLADTYGSNPYSPSSWQAHCSRHRYTYYLRNGCYYCKLNETDN